MTKAKIIGICASLAAAAAIVVTVIMLSGEEAYRILKIFEVNGTGNVDRQSTVISAYEGMKLESNDTLSVGNESTIRLSLDDNKYILLDQNTVMSFKAEGNAENSLTRIELREGAILNEVTEALSADSLYEVNTPKTTMAVRGTSFSVEVIPEKDGYLTYLSVLHGIVSVQLYDENGNPKGNPVSVGEGFSVAIFTENGVDSAGSADAFGNAYFVLLKEDGFVAVPDGESPLFELDGNLIPDAIKEQALKSDETGLLKLKIAVADELRDKEEQPEQTTVAVTTQPPVSETTTTTTTTAEETTTTTVTEAVTTTTEQTTAVTSAVTTTAAPVTVVTTTTLVTTTEEITTTEETTAEETITTEEATTTEATTVTTTRTTTSPSYQYYPTITTTSVTTPFTSFVTTPEIVVTTTTTEATTPAPVMYTVEFYDENGELVYSEEVEEGGTVSSIPDVPEKTGYTGMWQYNGDEYTGAAVSGDMKITAVYTINTYNVTFRLEGVENVEPFTEEYEYGEVVELPEIPDFEYYTHTLWQYNNEEYEPLGSVTVESDMEFVAEYSPATVYMEVMIPNYSYGSPPGHYDTIPVTFGKAFSENERGYTVAQMLELYDDPTTAFPDELWTSNGWVEYTADHAKVGFDVILTDDTLIDETVVSSRTDNDGNTYYYVYLEIVYTERLCTITYLIKGYTENGDLDENGFGVYLVDGTANYNNSYDFVPFPTVDGKTGYWSLDMDGSTSKSFLNYAEDTIVYGFFNP